MKRLLRHLRGMSDEELAAFGAQIDRELRDRLPTSASRGSPMVDRRADERRRSGGSPRQPAGPLRRAA